MTLSSTISHIKDNACDMKWVWRVVKYLPYLRTICLGVIRPLVVEADHLVECPDVLSTVNLVHMVYVCCINYHLLAFLLFMLLHMSVFLMQCSCRPKFHVRVNEVLTYLLTYLLVTNSTVSLRLSAEQFGIALDQQLGRSQN